MGVALGWMALALAVVGGAPDAGQGGVPIRYSVRFVEVEGLGWRDTALARMTPVTRQGAATVWTAPSDVAKRLISCAAKSPSARVTEVPKVTAFSGATAHITTRASTRQFVTQVAWDRDQGTGEARSESVRTGWAVTMAGRKLDQGILVQMVLQDTQILAVHRVALSGKPAPTDPAAKKASYDPLKTGADAAPCCSSATGGSCCAVSEAPKAAVEVPEIGSQEVAGEWVIPKDGVLLVSFGPHTVADKDGKAVIRERLAIVEADEAAAPIGATVPHQAPWGSPVYRVVPVLPAPTAMAAAPAMASPSAAPAPIAVPAAPAAAMPPMPSRSIPQGYHADGKAAELPPLPPDEADADDDDDSSASAETRPSPQAKKLRKPGAKRVEKPEPPADTAMKKVQFSIANFQAIPSLFHQVSDQTVGLQFLLPIKPVSVKLPFNRRLELEIYGKVVHAPEPAHGSADLARKPAADGATTK